MLTENLTAAVAACLVALDPFIGRMSEMERHALNAALHEVIARHAARIAARQATGVDIGVQTETRKR